MRLLMFWNIWGLWTVTMLGISCAQSHFFIFVCLSFPSAVWELNRTFCFLLICLHYLHNLKRLEHCFYFCCVYCSTVSSSLGSLGIFHNTDNKFNRSLSLFFFFSMPLATELSSYHVLISQMQESIFRASLWDICSSLNKVLPDYKEMMLSNCSCPIDWSITFVLLARWVQTTSDPKIAALPKTAQKSRGALGIFKGMNHKLWTHLGCKLHTCMMIQWGGWEEQSPFKSGLVIYVSPFPLIWDNMFRFETVVCVVNSCCLQS